MPRFRYKIVLLCKAAPCIGLGCTEIQFLFPHFYIFEQITTESSGGKGFEHSRLYILLRNTMYLSFLSSEESIFFFVFMCKRSLVVISFWLNLTHHDMLCQRQCYVRTS